MFHSMSQSNPLHFPIEDATEDQVITKLYKWKKSNSILDISPYLTVLDGGRNVLDVSNMLEKREALDSQEELLKKHSDHLNSFFEELR
jgi:hypothetical protein